jgi:hypothetical protein
VKPATPGVGGGRRVRLGLPAAVSGAEALHPADDVEAAVGVVEHAGLDVVGRTHVREPGLVVGGPAEGDGHGAVRDPRGPAAGVAGLDDDVVGLVAEGEGGEASAGGQRRDEHGAAAAAVGLAAVGLVAQMLDVGDGAVGAGLAPALGAALGVPGSDLDAGEACGAGGPGNAATSGVRHRGAPLVRQFGSATPASRRRCWALRCMEKLRWPLGATRTSESRPSRTRSSRTIS